jgi:hypothetical protein
LTFSAPVVLIAVLVAAKLWSIVIWGGYAATNFSARDANGLATDVAALRVVNVVEPGKAYFAAGALATLRDRLPQADQQFTAALARTDPVQSCPVRIDLELVREALGDRAATALDGNAAVGWYRSALTATRDAPQGCFSGSADSDAARRALLNDTIPRLNAKIDAASAAPPAAPPAPQQAPPQAPPQVESASPVTAPDDRLRLNPGAGDPLQRLQQILQDAAAARGRA